MNRFLIVSNKSYFLLFHPDEDIIRENGQEFGGVTARLTTNELWAEFSRLGTEMIVTKAGRFTFFQILFIYKFDKSFR